MASAQTATLEGPWTVFEIDDDLVAAGIEVTINFTGDAATGMAGCNSFRATATTSGTDLGFGPVALSRKVCPIPNMDTETAFVRALQRVSRYQIDAKGVLTLFGRDTALLRARR